MMRRMKSDQAQSVGRSDVRNAALYRFLHDPAAVAALVVLLVIVLACLCAPLLTSYRYDQINMSVALARPSAAHPFGCDYCGRDQLCRVLYGGRMTLRIAVTAALISAALGLLIGLLCGCVGGRTDLLLMRLMEVLSSIPSLLLVILAEAILGWGHGNFLYAMAAASLPSFVRLTRAAVLQVMGRSYIDAARALGVHGLRLVWKHVLPNILPTLLIHLTGNLAEQVMTCSIMGFLGIGVNPPIPEWGLLVYEGYGTIRSAPHTVLMPAIIVAVCILAINLVGNGLRDAVEGGERADG